MTLKTHSLFNIDLYPAAIESEIVTVTFIRNKPINFGRI